MNLVVGRACFESGKTRLYAYVHNQAASAATRLDHVLTASGVGHNDRVSIFTDGAGEFEKAVNGASRPICCILDWFHIAMKFRAISLTACRHRVSVYLQFVTFTLSIGTKWTAQNFAYHWERRKKDGAGVEKVHLKRR